MQAEYESEFWIAVRKFLNLHQDHAKLTGPLSRAVADHAMPVRNGTVARTESIPVEQLVARVSSLNGGSR